jgi:hypothetical protein
MLLRWEQKHLAERSGISLTTIKRLESKPGPLGAYADTVTAIRRAFEDEGIEFSNGDRPGVHLDKTRSEPAKTAPPKKTRQRRS